MQHYLSAGMVKGVFCSPQQFRVFLFSQDDGKNEGYYTSDVQWCVFGSKLRAINMQMSYGRQSCRVFHHHRKGFLVLLFDRKFKAPIRWEKLLSLKIPKIYFQLFSVKLQHTQRVCDALSLLWFCCVYGGGASTSTALIQYILKQGVDGCKD